MDGDGDDADDAADEADEAAYCTYDLEDNFQPPLDVVVVRHGLVYLKKYLREKRNKKCQEMISGR